MPPSKLNRSVTGKLYGCSTRKLSWYSVKPAVGSSGQSIFTSGPTGGPTYGGIQPSRLIGPASPGGMAGPSGALPPSPLVSTWLVASEVGPSAPAAPPLPPEPLVFPPVPPPVPPDPAVAVPPAPPV